MADLKKEKARLAKKYKKTSLLHPSPMRVLARYMNNKDLDKKEKSSVNKLIMKVDDMKEADEKAKISKEVDMMIRRMKYKIDLKKRQSKKENKST
tara:strand:- start:51 stop:335 length:285 start_codon:yes stop_codon:yes gene_type:complete